MEKIYVIGDIHTVSAFRLAGVRGVVSGGPDASAHLEDVIQKGDAAIVVMTNDLAEDLSDRIGQINLELPFPVVVTIPGMDDLQGFRRSVTAHVSRALGISL